MTLGYSRAKNAAVGNPAGTRMMQAVPPGDQVRITIPMIQVVLQPRWSSLLARKCMDTCTRADPRISHGLVLPTRYSKQVQYVNSYDRTSPAIDNELWGYLTFR